MKSMFALRGAAALLLGASLTAGALAQNPDEHAGHHPPQAVAAPTAVAAAAAPSDGAMPDMDAHMRAMHEKMAAARTPDERQALMNQHMRIMHGDTGALQGMGSMHSHGMGVMSSQGGATGGGMGGLPAMAQHHEAMEKRMDMMMSMMQAMIDRLPPTGSR